MFCSHCGKEISDNAVICVHCGCAVDAQKVQNAVEKGGKSKITAGLLALFLGGVGVHNFYLGYTGKGIAQILLCWTGISAIWALIEGISILTGGIKTDAQGNFLV